MFKLNELLKVTSGRLIGQSRNTLIKGISIDSRSMLPGQAFLALKGDNFDGHDFIDEAVRKGASCIIAEPRVCQCTLHKVVAIEVKDTIRALGKIAAFQRKKFDIPVIAVTGSNGKTTTKEMIAAVLSKKFNVLKNMGTKNNHIGLPMTLVGLDQKYDCAVLEIGTNHFGEVRYLADIARPNIGIITNIGPAHLEYFQDLHGVLREKGTLMRCLGHPRISVLNADDKLLKRRISGSSKEAPVFSLGIENKADFSASNISCRNRGIKLLVNQKYKFTLKTMGYYNIYNALVAVAVARIFGIEYRDIATSLAAFRFLQNRLVLKKLHNIRFIDDTYNSNPVSLNQALETLGSFSAKGRKIFIMGDMLELGAGSGKFHEHVGERVYEVCDALITVGKFSRLAASAAEKFGFDNKNIFTCESALEARDILFNKISPCCEDIVLVKGSRAMKMEEVLKF